MNTADGTPKGNHLDKYAATNPIERRMMDHFLRTLDDLLPSSPPRSILEVGVGEGEILTRLAARYPGARVVGVDLHDERLLAEWAARDLPCEVGDATALRFADGEFDLVLAIEVLEHIPSPERALTELARVSAGQVVMSVPFEPIWRFGNLLRGRYVRDWGNTPGHVNHWTRRSFRRFVASHLEVEQVASPLPWTMLRARPRR